MIDRRTGGICTLVCAAILVSTGLRATSIAALSFTSQDRIVNLGDSHTDGQTYALLTQAALAEAGKPVPLFIGAGIGGDAASGMLMRLDRDVLVHRPTWVMLSCGANDANTGVQPSDFEVTLKAIVKRLKEERVQLILLTITSCRGGVQAKEREALNAIIRRIASEHHLPLAEVFNPMEAARANGVDLWEDDGRHLNLEGYRIMSRAVLDAMGYSGVPIPDKLHCALLPGTIADWKILTVDDGGPFLTEERAAALQPDENWKDLKVPDEKPQPHWWREQERSRGFAVSLNARFGGTRHIAFAEVTSEARPAYVNTGADIKAVWLNGKRLAVEPHGWHAGNNRVPVELREGKNTIVVECDDSFFLSITETNTW
jgi:Lysophospholipase L1 and related esterases